MYLTAQHVVAADGAEGVNAYYYSHGPRVWRGFPPAGVPDEDPGVLVHHTLLVRPGGNRVRSFLDLVTPDEAPWTEIRPSFVTFVSSNQGSPFPWEGVVDRVFVRIGMDQGVAGEWQREVANLYRAAQAVRIGG